MQASHALALGSSVLLSTACIVSNPSPAAAPQGMQVRLTSWHAGPYPLEGTLVYAEADTLKLHVRRQGVPVAVPVWTITRLEVYRGRKGSVGGAVKGAGIGAVAGAAMGTALGITTEAVFGGMFGRERDYGEAAAEAATEMAITGAFVGATAGATVGDAVWQDITVHDLREELCHCRIPRHYD